MTETEALAALAALARACNELDREAEDDPNGGFGPGMQAAVREFRAILEQVEPGVAITHEEAKRALGWYARLPVGVAREDVAFAERLKTVADD